ncbi:hypothetical protein ACLB1R_01510 [Escherichia coli]
MGCTVSADKSQLADKLAECCPTFFVYPEAIRKVIYTTKTQSNR